MMLSHTSLNRLKSYVVSIMIDTMEHLGKACGIDVGAATVALINFE
jgi:ribosomal protein L7Ae-like RNA K-turn-binding protein